MKRQNKYTIWIETQSGETNPVEIGIREKDIEPMVKKWSMARKIFIEDISLTKKNQKKGVKSKEWGYIAIVETRGE